MKQRPNVSGSRKTTSAALMLLLSVLLTTYSCGGGGSETDATGFDDSADSSSSEVLDSANSGDNISRDGEDGYLYDTVPDDGLPDILPGEFGYPCRGNDECDSGYCVSSNTGPICTKLCFESCPEGFACRSVANTAPDVVFICVPDSTPVCSPCAVDGQCGDGRCVTASGSSFCSIDCKTVDNCPDGFICSPDDAGKTACIPVTGACDCRPGNDGVVRACSVSADSGTCRGIQECDPQVGWSGCSAPAPAAETCNGLDDDCNGIPDDGLEASRECFNSLEGIGSCAGSERCLGSLGWVCDARTPETERCDYLDNDCDGSTDEDFLTDGKYAGTEFCGSCTRSCVGSLQNATAVCSNDYQSPQCVVESCSPGYHKVNEFQCISNTNTLCMPCADDLGCLAEGGRCLQYEDGRYCAVPCGADSGCPLGYYCDTTLAEGGYSGQCRPSTDRCGCGEDNPNAVRSCSVTFQNDDSTTVTCFGLQKCGAGEWSACELPPESCDGLDNDCDGLIDEDFRDPQTDSYNLDAHCGACFNNCGVLAYPNSAGRCVDDGLVPFCSISCSEDYVDVNGELIDGCECLLVEGVDAPDGPDSNCDGIDGDIQRAVFVSRTGRDDNDGTIEHPVRTIGTGISVAFSLGLPEVYVATGVYEETVSITPGISVYGGYSPDFKSHDPLIHESVVMAPAGSPAVLAEDIRDGGEPSVFDGFTIYGSDAVSAGTSSYTVIIRRCDSSLTVSGNRIIAGNGAAGARGDAGTQGTNGTDGAQGSAARDIGGSCGTSLTAGGAGGQLACGETATDGGAGGSSACPDFDEDVLPGSNPSYPYTQTVTGSTVGQPGTGPGPQSTGGTPGFDQLIDPDTGGCANCVLPPSGLPRTGQPGADGLNGTDGTGGVGCLAPEGNVISGLWAAAVASSGTAGIPGNGGGGGGAGGGVETVDCQAAQAAWTDLGGSGGGGGSGACGGSGGLAGTSGGGSFGLFIVFDGTEISIPIVTGNTVRAGRGGNGGDGGNGGLGGSGGKAGAGGSDGAGNVATFCAPAGGKGGNGGDGGNGGGGGGGCGGPSYCIFVGGSTPSELNAFGAENGCEPGFPGTGGMGGASPASPGSAGSTGIVARDNFSTPG